MARAIDYSVFFDWDFDDTYSNETDYVVSLSVERGLTGVGNPFTSSFGKVDRATIELKNSDSRYSSRITTGALYSDLQNGGMYQVPVRISISTGGVSYRIFTGVATIPSETSTSLNKRRTIKVLCLSNEEKLRNTRLSLSIAKAKEWFDNLPTESDVIDYIATQTGETITTDFGTFAMLPLYHETSALELLWNIARSSAGYFYTKRTGEFVYDNMYSLVGKTSVVTLDDSEYNVVQMVYPEVDISSRVTVGGANGRLVEGESVFTKILSVDPSSTVTVIDDFSDYVYEIDAETYTALSAVGVDLSGDLSITKTVTARGIEISFENTGSTRMFINYSLTATIIDIFAFTVESESSDSFWDDRNEVTTKVRQTYLYSEGLAQSVADMILDRQQTPVPMFQIVDAIYNNALELLDVITISDSSVSSSNVDVLITDLSYNLSYQGGCRLTIKGIEYSNLYPYLSTDEYFIVGTNELGASGSGHDVARLIY